MVFMLRINKISATWLLAEDLNEALLVCRANLEHSIQQPTAQRCANAKQLLQLVQWS